jgi:hypothetical protein
MIFFRLPLILLPLSFYEYEYTHPFLQLIDFRNESDAKRPRFD